MPIPMPMRAHVICGGFPPGQPAGHDHDYARLKLLELLAEADVPASVGNDYVDIERWLPISRLLITYTAGPILADPQTEAVKAWLAAGGRWLSLHGSSGGKAARVEGSPRRRMVKTEHHETMGGFFLSHPPVCRFRVDRAAANEQLIDGLPEHFETIDEPYMVQVLRPQESRILLTAPLGPDPLPGKFGFDYEEDTALLPDGLTRVIAYARDIGEGGVAYTTLGHCHTPATNSQPFVDASVDPDGKTPPVLRTTWEQPAYLQFLRNGIAWGARQK